MSDLPLDTVLQDDVLYMCRIKEADWAQSARLNRKSVDFMRHLSPPPPESAYRRSAFRAHARNCTNAWTAGIAYAFHVFRHKDDTLLGFANLHHVDHNASSAMIGFAIGVDHARQGVGYRAGNLLLGLAFDRLGINRVQAFCVLANTPSAGLLAKLGLREEGIARGMLKVGDERKDARQFAMLQHDWRARRASARQGGPS